MTPDFYSFFLKGILIVNEIKIIREIFNIRFFNIRIYSKNKFQFSMNCQNISCNILSQHGIKAKPARFLKGLMSWAII